MRPKSIQLGRHIRMIQKKTRDKIHKETGCLKWDSCGRGAYIEVNGSQKLSNHLSLGKISMPLGTWCWALCIPQKSADWPQRQSSSVRLFWTPQCLLLSNNSESRHCQWVQNSLTSKLPSMQHVRRLGWAEYAQVCPLSDLTWHTQNCRHHRFPGGLHFCLKTYLSTVHLQHMIRYVASIGQCRP